VARADVQAHDPIGEDRVSTGVCAAELRRTPNPKDAIMSIRRTLAFVAATAALVLASATAASAAGSPHFIKNATSASLSGTSLVVEFKEAGLSSGSVETITISAQLDATYSCVNNGGNVPSDPKKTNISSDVSTSGEFTAGKNGNAHAERTRGGRRARLPRRSDRDAHLGHVVERLDHRRGQRSVPRIEGHVRILSGNDDEREGGALPLIMSTFSRRARSSLRAPRTTR
jgi:hypothetical protein